MFNLHEHRFWDKSILLKVRFQVISNGDTRDLEEHVYIVICGLMSQFGIRVYV